MKLKLIHNNWNLINNAKVMVIFLLILIKKKQTER